MRNTIFYSLFASSLILVCAAGILAVPSLASPAHAATKNIATRYDESGSPSCQARLSLNTFNGSTFFEYVDIYAPADTEFQAVRYTMQWTDGNQSLSQVYAKPFGSKSRASTNDPSTFGWASNDYIPSSTVSSGALTEVFVDTDAGTITCDVTNATATPTQADQNTNNHNRCDGSNHLLCTLFPYKQKW